MKFKGRTITEDKELIALASSNLSQEGKEVVRNALGVLAHESTWVGASRVEVAQQSTVPFLGLGVIASLGGIVTLGVDHIGDGVLNGELGVSVGVGGAERAHLGDGNHVREAGSIAVDGSGAREDDVGDVVADHGAQEADGAVDVHMVVVQGLLAGFADGLVEL